MVVDFRLWVENGLLCLLFDPKQARIWAPVNDEHSDIGSWCTGLIQETAEGMWKYECGEDWELGKNSLFRLLSSGISISLLLEGDHLPSPQRLRQALSRG